MRLFSRLVQLLRVHWMLAASMLAALVSTLIVPPDEAYLGYFDWKTIGCLFCVLAVASAFRDAGIFDWAAQSIIRRFRSLRVLAMMFVLVTAVFSMAFTNDVALVIMLPLSVAVLIKLDQPQLVPVVFVLQALAANLCGMVTPFGNPQNLYLFSYYHVTLGEFLLAIALPFALSVAGIAILMLLMTGRFAGLQDDRTPQAPQDASMRGLFDTTSTVPLLDRRRLVAYVPLFIVTLLSVFRIIPVAAAAIAVAFVLAVLDRRALLRVDYSLLVTFLCFFVFAGNMARIPALEEFLSPIMNHRGLAASALTSQIISNVPAAVLLSHFTQVWQPLLVGVNIGGAGTFVGSLASLIVIRHFIIARTMVPRMSEPDAPTTSSFLCLFGIVNAVFFIVLLVICQLAQG